MKKKDAIDVIRKFSIKSKSKLSGRTFNKVGNALIRCSNMNGAEKLLYFLSLHIPYQQYAYFIASSLFEKWSTEKEVYFFNDTLTEEILKMDANDRVPLGLLSRLPYHDFYVAAKISSNIAGFFVSYEVSSTTEHRLSFAYINKNGSVLSTNEVNFPDTGEHYFSENDPEFSIRIKEYRDDLPDDYKILLNTMNVLFYMCSINADIQKTENSSPHCSQMQKISQINNEITGWNVGYRVGPALKRKWQDSLIKNTETSDPSIQHELYKTKRFHVRRAHYHHYWIGKRNSTERKLILKWIEPTFVGIHSVKDPVVLHMAS